MRRQLGGETGREILIERVPVHGWPANYEFGAEMDKNGVKSQAFNGQGANADDIRDQVDVQLDAHVGVEISHLEVGGPLPGEISGGETCLGKWAEVEISVHSRVHSLQVEMRDAEA